MKKLGKLSLSHELENLRYCKKCCQLLTRPKLYVENDVCGGCLWEEEKERIDWGQRSFDVRVIASEARRKARWRKTYDCAIGVSGGKDSTFQALYAKEMLGLNCLLVSAFPDEITEIGKKNFDNLVNQGFDCIRIYVNPQLLKQLMRRDFFEYLHFRKATEYPLWASVYTVAKEKNIPLIIQGENAALTLGVSEDMNTDWDASTVYKTNTIAGATAIEHYPEVPREQLKLYTFPDMSDWDGKAIWLNYFVKEWSQWDNAQFAISRGLEVRIDTMENLGRIHPWTCLDSDFHMVSQYHKFCKLGFGFATDECAYNIRENRMTREEGFDLIDKYDGKCADKYIDRFCEFVGITREEHDVTVDKFANRDLMIKVGNRWELKPDLKKLRYS